MLCSGRLGAGGATRTTSHVGLRGHDTGEQKGREGGTLTMTCTCEAWPREGAAGRWASGDRVVRAQGAFFSLPARIRRLQPRAGPVRPRGRSNSHQLGDTRRAERVALLTCCGGPIEHVLADSTDQVGVRRREEEVRIQLSHVRCARSILYIRLLKVDSTLSLVGGSGRRRSEMRTCIQKKRIIFLTLFVQVQI